MVTAPCWWHIQTHSGEVAFGMQLRWTGDSFRVQLRWTKGQCEGSEAQVTGGQGASVVALVWDCRSSKQLHVARLGVHVRSSHTMLH